MKILRFVVLLLIPLLGFASVTSQVDKSGPFLITGSPQTIPTGFPFVTSSELLVLDTGPTSSPNDPATVLTLGSDYTVTGGGYNGANQMQTGSVVVVSSGSHSVATNDYIVIMRNVPINQTSSFINTGPNTVLLLERMGDKLATLSQQVNQIGSRSLRFENFEFLDGTLSKSARAGNLLGFDADGVPTYYATEFTPGVVTSITGTANEITVTPTQGNAVASLPTALTFTGKTVTGGTFNGGTINAISIEGNSNTGPLPAGLSGTIFQLGQADGVNTRATIDGFGASPIIEFRRAQGTNASKTAVTTGIFLGTVSAGGYETTQYSSSRAAINFVTSQNWTDSAQGLNIEFRTTPIGSTSSLLTHTFSPLGLTFETTGQRITGDFSNATRLSRVLFQTSTTNGATNLGAIPNGSEVTTSFSFYNAPDADNAGKIQVNANATQMQLNSGKNGSGTTLALALAINDVAQLLVKTSGVVNLTTVTNYASNAAAISGGLVAGDVYRNGDNLCIVH